MLQNLAQVNFTTKNGDTVLFDKLGDPVARYSIVNWQRNHKGAIVFESIGMYDASRQDGEEFVINTNSAVWAGNQHTVSTADKPLTSKHILLLCLLLNKIIPKQGYMYAPGSSVCM